MIRRLAPLVVVVALGCSSSEPRPSDGGGAPTPPPAAATAPSSERPAAAPREKATLEPAAVAVEVSPVASDARVLLEGYRAGALDAATVALALERMLGSNDQPFVAAPGWVVSSHAALVHAIRIASPLLRSSLARDQDPRYLAAVAAVGSARVAGSLARAYAIADRYPAATHATSTWDRVEAERAVHEAADPGALAGPVPPGGLAVSGLRILADGDDGLVAEDEDRNHVWAHRAPAPVRVFAIVADRLIAMEGRSVAAIDVTTGDELARGQAFERSPRGLRAVVNGELVLLVAADGQIAVFDALAPRLVWRRDLGRPCSLGAVTATTVTLEGAGVTLDLATGRRTEPPRAVAPRAKKGTIEIR